jgi:general secretion pathway protein G
MTGKFTGFTLIEVMVVVAILGVLGAIVVPRIMSRPDEARIIKAQQDIRAISAALDLYKLDNLHYPTIEQGIEALIEDQAISPNGARRPTGGYLARVPIDPWGRGYLYLQPGEHGPFDLYSLGADGAVGGDHADADIGNWHLN